MKKVTIKLSRLGRTKLLFIKIKILGFKYPIFEFQMNSAIYGKKAAIKKLIKNIALEIKEIIFPKKIEVLMG